MDVIAAEGHLLDRVLDATYRVAHGGMTRHAWGQLHRAQASTPWGQRCQRTFALVAGDEIIASTEASDLAGVLDSRPVRVRAFGPVSVASTSQGIGHARTLVETLVSTATLEGFEMALLFPQTLTSDGAEENFQPIPCTDLTLSVTQSARHGAPMTMVRGGEDRDLAAIVAMGRTRAEPFRFHLDRDTDLVRQALTRQRLLAGLQPGTARQLQFFIAEEGTTAAAYVILSVAGDTWTLEECGDRDVSGARVGALLQALIAREPAERRPTIRAWLPHGFLPPQVQIASATPSPHTIGVRMLGSHALPMTALAAEHVLLWRSDVV